MRSQYSIPFMSDSFQQYLPKDKQDLPNLVSVLHRLSKSIVRASGPPSTCVMGTQETSHLSRVFNYFLGVSLGESTNRRCANWLWRHQVESWLLSFPKEAQSMSDAFEIFYHEYTLKLGLKSKIETDCLMSWKVKVSRNTLSFSNANYDWLSFANY